MIVVNVTRNVYTSGLLGNADTSKVNRRAFKESHLWGTRVLTY